MDSKLFALLLLVLGAVATQSAERHVTLRSIVSSVFAQDQVANKDILPANLEVSAKSFTFTSSRTTLEKTLLSKGMPGYIARNMPLTVFDPSVDEFRATRFVHMMQSEYGSVSAVCIYRSTETKFQMNFVCLAAVGFHDSVNTPEVSNEVKKVLYMSMKDQAMTLPLSYNVFTSRTLEQFSALGSAKTQAELGKIMKAEVATRDEIVQNLNNNKNDPFLARLYKNGLTHYTSASVIDSIEGVDSAQLTKFSNYLADKLALPSTMRRALIDQLYLASISDRAEWKDIAFTYKLNVGEAKYMSVMTVTDEASNTMDFLVCDIKAGFQMAPDILVTTVTKSKFFGLFKSTSIKIDRRPAELTDKSIDLLFKFFKVSVFDKFRKFKGF